MNEISQQKPSNLKVVPQVLDFGLVDLAQLNYNQPSVELKICNTGGGIIRIRLIPLVDWVKTNVEEVNLGENETIVREVQLRNGFPRHWNKRKYSIDCILIIKSSAGSIALGSTYQTVPGQAQPRVSNAWILVMIGVVLSGLVAIPILARFALGRSLNAVQVDPQLYYTQGALTAYAALTSTSLFAATRTYTPTPYVDGTAAGLFSLSKTPAKTPTFTPWPRERFANPELFIRDYYTGLNKRQYDKTWRMLSTRFQQDCCIVAGNDPFSVYRAYWDGVEKVEVVYAYLQQWDSNPAVVNVAIKYAFKRGDKLEETYVFQLISDTETQSLLIDVVK